MPSDLPPILDVGALPPPPPLPPPSSNEVFAIFAGFIDQAAVQRIFNAFSIAANNGVTHIHLLFQTAGGQVSDSVCLYNFFRTLPFDLTVYNVGSVVSGGVLVYLGAKHRKTSANATFMIHRSWATAQGATSDRLQALTNSLILDDERTELILREHVELSDEQWSTHKVADLWLSAREAVDASLADEIGDFAPPKGRSLFYVGTV
jgi:ATP-dependent Clp protease protease subunit